jgi:predicted amidohydrolase YtcJ
MRYADKIFRGGPILTIDSERPEAEALAITGDRITAVGAWQEIEALLGPDTVIVELDGNTLMPGFVEAHGHPLLSAVAWGDPVVDIRAIHTPTYAAAIEKIRRRVAKAKPGEILWFLGLDPQLHAGMEEPSKAELDALSPTNPLAVQTSNYHGLYLNTVALKAFGVEWNYVPPEGGQVYRDDAGSPWKFQETACWQIANRFYEICGRERNLTSLKDWLWMFARAGYTASAEILLLPGFTGYFEAALGRSRMPIRVFGYEAATVNGVMSVGHDYGDDRFTVKGMKVIGDGSVLLGNVWVSQPYLNTEMTLRKMGLPRDNTGHMNYTRDELETLVAGYAEGGWQIAVHAHGDRTIDVALDVYERVIPQYPQAAKPFRLEHCGTMREDQIDRAVKLGVCCSFFLPYIYHWGEALRDTLLGQDRAENFVPSGSATRKGMRVSYHCDPPMTWPHALLCLHLAVTRRSRAGNVIGAAQRVDMAAALRAVTIDAAYQLRMDDKIGSLAPGKYADLAVLSADPLKHDPEKILEISILGTYLGGELMWKEGLETLR